MSKRRAEDSCSENYDLDTDMSPIMNKSGSNSLRSIRLKNQLNPNSSRALQQQVIFSKYDEVVLYELLCFLDDNKDDNMYIPNELRKKLVVEYLQQFPESNYLKPLRYTNQIIEIPIFSNVCSIPPKLYYNENFPFRREPTSLSVNIEKFISNISNYSNLRKLIVKNAKIKIIPNSFTIYNNDNDQISFCFDCCLYGMDNNCSTHSTIDESILEGSNILLSHKNIWLIIFNIIKTESESQERITFLLNLIFTNLSNIFNMMENIDVVVSVNGNHDFKISHILHHYYTN